MVDFGNWNFMDDDEFHPRSNKGDQSKVFITSLKADTPQVFYFLTKPSEWEGDWVNFRELNTREGLKVGPDLPNDLKYGVMVQDYRVVNNEITGKREIELDNNLDPITAGAPGQQLWAVGTRNTDAKGLVRVQRRCAVNVVDAITGYHKIVKISMTAKEDLVKYFQVKDEDGDFDIQGRPYEILYTGEGFNWNLAIRPVRPGSSVMRDGKGVEVPAHPELGSAIDIRTVLIEQREELDAILASMPTRSGNPVDTSTAPDFVQVAMAEMESAFTPEAKEQSLSEKYLAMSPARLRSMLAKAKIDVERGATKEAMANIAAENNL